MPYWIKQFSLEQETRVTDGWFIHPYFFIKDNKIVKSIKHRKEVAPLLLSKEQSRQKINELQEIQDFYPVLKKLLTHHTLNLDNLDEMVWELTTILPSDWKPPSEGHLYPVPFKVVDNLAVYHFDAQLLGWVLYHLGWGIDDGEWSISHSQQILCLHDQSELVAIQAPITCIA